MNRGEDRLTIYPWQTEYGVRLSQAQEHARNLSDDELLRLPTNAITESLVNEHAAQPLVIQFDEMWWENKDSPIWTGVNDGSFEVSANFTATGCIGALTGHNTQLSISTNSGGGKPSVIRVHLKLKDSDPTDLNTQAFRQALSFARENLRTSEQQANREIAAHRTRMFQEVLPIVAHRGRRLKAFRQATDELGIPLTPASTPSLIDLRPRGISLRQLDQEFSAGVPEWHLEEAIAEDITTKVMSFTSAMERLTETSDKLAGENEETIRDLLLFILNASYQGAATGETFVGKGKTDILLSWRGRNAFIGECKFWLGSRKFSDALSQLLDRYTVWRDTHVALILFIRGIVRVGEVIEKANTCITSSERFIQAITPEEPDRRRDYLVRAMNDQSRVIHLSLLPVVIPKVGR